MTKDEALKLALEALDCIYSPLHVREINKVGAAMTAIKEALAQPRQEPFGHVTVRRLSQRLENHHDQYQFYPAGQSPYLDNVDECHTVYTTPPQRTWVGLTDEEINLIYAEPQTHIGQYARAIETKLKEKNT